jgi:hypothetical protein
MYRNFFKKNVEIISLKELICSEWCDICKNHIQISNNTIKLLPLYKKPLLLSSNLSKKPLLLADLSKKSDSA